MRRLRCLGLAFMMCCASVYGSAARAEFPEHGIDFLVGAAPGGGADLMARLIAKILSEDFGQPVVVVSRPSANGTAAASALAHAPADGYTILQISGNHTTPAVGYTTDYDPLKSFAPITWVGFVPLALVVNPSVPANNLDEFIAYAKANPGKLNLGDTGPGSTAFWASTLLMKQTGTKITHVSYKGGGPALVGLLGNEVQLTFSPMSTSLPMVNEGKLKALAITGAERSPLMQSVPTFGELKLQGFEDIGELAGVIAPAGTPKPIVDKLNAAIVKAIKSDEFQKVMLARGFTSMASTPEEFTRILKEEIDRWEAMRAFADTPQ